MAAAYEEESIFGPGKIAKMSRSSFCLPKNSSRRENFTSDNIINYCAYYVEIIYLRVYTRKYIKVNKLE